MSETKKTGTIIQQAVYPSEEYTVIAMDDTDESGMSYGGAHTYQITECNGFNNGETEYTNSVQILQFVQKNLDGTMRAGLQSEQVVIALLDRHKKLNDKFPSPQNAKMVEGLQMFLDACKERVEDRMGRGVMGQLKN